MGRFIVIEGIDGSGTTTQAQLLVEWLRSRRRIVLATREPTAGPVGKLIRRVLAADPDAPSERALPWLFAADRADHVFGTIQPTLAAGSDVVSDRYYHSSLAYQSLTLPLERVHTLNADFRTPDLTVVLQVPVEVCLARLRERAKRTAQAPEIYEVRERLERIDAEYRAVIALLREHGEPIAEVDGDGPADAVAERIRDAVAALF